MRRRFSLPGCGAALAAMVWPCGVFLPAHGQTPTDILSYHGGNLVSNGVNGTEQVITPSGVNVTTFGVQFATGITDVPNVTGIPTSAYGSGMNYTAAAGQVYAEPLIKTGVNITTGNYQGIHDVVFVGTTMDSLYAIDADGGTVLWKDSFIYNSSGNPNPLNAAIPAGVTAVLGGYGGEINTADVSPWIGIIGTPVIDGVNGYIYVAAKTREADGNENQPHFVYRLHKVRLSDGFDTSTVIADTTVVNPTTNPTYNYNSGPYVMGNSIGSVPLNGNGPSVIYFNAVRQMVRSALQLYNGNIIIASGSHGDNDPYHGWILSYNAATLACNGAWNATPNGSTGEGGVWQGGGGVVIDSSGNMYFQTGNGAFDGNNTNGIVTGLDGNGFPVNGNYGDCFVKLAVDPTTTQGNQGTNLNGWGLKVVDYFAPSDNQSLAEFDRDLGSGGPTLLPDSAGSTAHPHLLVGGGKEGTLYLIDRDNMGKFGNTDSVVQEIAAAFGQSNDGPDSVPAFFNGRLYLMPAYGGKMHSWPLSNGTIATSSVQTTPDTNSYPGCSPFVTANNTANGVVWTLDQNSSQLRAYDAGNLASELYTSSQNASRDALGSAVKFAVPTVANGRVYVGTGDHLVVYGSTVVPTTTPAAPTNLFATATGASTISLTWTDNSNNENGFHIERSNDGQNFTEVAVVGVNVASFSDSRLSSQATYYYRVRAANTFNTLSYSAYTNVANATTPSLTSQTPTHLYHFDEDAGATTIDSADGNTGTLVGSPPPSWVVPGRIGSSCLSFSGTGQYLKSGQSAVQLNSDLSGTLGQTSSLLFWIKTSQTGNNSAYQAPAVTGAEQASGDNGIAWGYLDATGHIGVAVGSGGSVLSASPINDGNWHHVALSRDAVSGMVDVYIDGALSSSATLETGAKTDQFFLLDALSVVNNDGVTLAGANYLNAKLDDVQVYNQVIDPAVVAQIALPPAAPTDLVAVPASGTELDLTWTDHATNDSGYEVWTSIANGVWTQLASLPVDANSFIDTGLNEGTGYSFYVVAANSVGTTDSNTVTVTTPSPPATPTNIVVTYLSPSMIGMSWTNNATTATGYTVLRRVNSGGFVQLATGLPPNTSSYQDAGVSGATTYDYHIEAYNVAGYSDFVGLSITTPTAQAYANYFTQFPSLTDTAPADDPGNVGYSNLLAYAFNASPMVSNLSKMPVTSVQNGFLTVSFVERIPPTDLTYTVEVSSDMTTWNFGPTYTTQVSVTPIDAATQMVTVRDNTAITLSNLRYIRVNVFH